MITDQQLSDFCTAVHAKIKANLGPEAETVHGLKPTTFERGPKYARIVKNDHQRSVFCFVELATGNILKAAGWKAPEKNHVRGNIANGAADVTPYGAQYIVR